MKNEPASAVQDLSRTPVHRADGSVWFWLDNETCKPVVPKPVERVPTFAEIAHERADMDRRGICYFIGGEGGPIKIGYSVDPASRLRSMQSGSPTVLAILATRSGGESRESAYHEQFREHRLHGEWFERSPEILAEIARLTPISSQREEVA